jgi:hypothetical protein
MPNKHCKRGYRCYESESPKPPKRQRPAPVALESRPPQPLLFQTDGLDNTRSRPSIKSAAGRCRFVLAAEAEAVTTPHGARFPSAWCARNHGSGAVESLSLGKRNVTLEAAMAIAGRHGPRRTLAGGRVP